MRRSGTLRESRLVHAAVGATALAAPASAAALVGSAQHATPQAAGSPGSPTGIQARLKSHRLAYGHNAILTGRAQAGQTVGLEFAPDANGSWRLLATSRVAPDGRFRLSAPLTSSGSVSVSAQSAGTTTPTPLAQDAATGSSAPQRVLVEAGIHIRPRSFTVFGQRRVGVRGRLLPAAADRRVVLQALRDGGWQTLSAARTGVGGRFELRYVAASLGRSPLRVRFGGDATNAAVARRAGMLVVYHPTIASWYYDGGTTGCGFHAYYGVANVGLPCGTQVSFSFGGRTVTAVVDDRGPFVGGRTWDLNENTAAALGFGGVGQVWSSS